MGVEPTQDGITAPQTVLKTAPVTGPGAAPQEGSIFACSGAACSAMVRRTNMGRAAHRAARPMSPAVLRGRAGPQAPPAGSYFLYLIVSMS